MQFIHISSVVQQHPNSIGVAYLARDVQGNHPVHCFTGLARVLLQLMVQLGDPIEAHKFLDGQLLAICFSDSCSSAESWHRVE
jgi:hypothetical protein